MWSLRDEYDRLDKLLRAHKSELRRPSIDDATNEVLRKCESCNQSDEVSECMNMNK